MKIHNHGLGLHVAEDGNPDGPTLAEHSPQIDVRVGAGAGHMSHDPSSFRATECAAIQEFLAASAG